MIKFLKKLFSVDWEYKPKLDWRDQHINHRRF